MTPAPRRAPAPANPEPTPAEIAAATRARLEAAIVDASAQADAAATTLAAALGRRREAIATLQRSRLYPGPSGLLSKLISPRSIDAGLAASGVAQLATIYIPPSARRSWSDQAGALFRRHPAQEENRP